MRRAVPLAAVVLVLAAATGCGPAGSLAPTATTSSAPPGRTPAAPTASAMTTPTPGGAAPPTSVGPPAVQPPVVPLPEPGLASMAAIPVEGVPAVAGQRFDHAVVCSPPILVLFDDAVADARSPDDAAGPTAWCNDGLLLALVMGVPGEFANPIGVRESDLDPPLVVRVLAGERFGAAAVGRLTAAAGDATVQVSVECTRPGEQYRLGAETLQCDPDVWAEQTFERASTLEQVLAELQLPADYSGTVSLRPRGM